MKKQFFLLIFSIFWISEIYANPCYLFVEKSGNFKTGALSSIAISLVGQYIHPVLAIPKAGIPENSCTYTLSLTESMSGFDLTLSGPDFNRIGHSNLRGIDGFTQSLLRSILVKLVSKERQDFCDQNSRLLDKECARIGETPTEKVVREFESKTPPENFDSDNEKRWISFNDLPRTFSHSEKRKNHLRMSPSEKRLWNKIDPRDQSLLKRGRQLIQKGKFQKAIHLFNRLLQHDPKHPVALFGRGLAKLKLHRNQGAIEDFKTACHENFKRACKRLEKLQNRIENRNRRKRD